MKLEARIDHLGAQGDGVAEGPEGPIFVPFALPGELVRVALEPEEKRAELLHIVTPSPERIDPICPHFGTCGGCALQHLEEGAYLRWKREQVVLALKARRLEVEVEPVRPVPLGSRRRASLTLGRSDGTLSLGYRRARSHALIDVETCPVLSPRIVASLPKLKAALAPILAGKREVRVSVTDTASGLDIVVEGTRPTPAALAAFAEKGAKLGIARLTVDGESMILGATPTIRLGSAAVKLPPGAFLQATAEAEASLVKLVREGTEGAKRIADLFAGVGTFSLPLAENAAVDAFEADELAVAALAEAVRMTPKLKPVRGTVRDLFRAPLEAKELRAYDAVVLDPPRQGAAAQVKALAASSVPALVMVSCNPATLARDLRILVDGGYSLTRVVPVDQFLFSPHIEIVAHLVR